MPHSSGGGSSSGGSYSGSDSSSSFSSSNSSGESESSMRCSHTYFSGARRFVGYRNGIEDIVYSNYDITKPVSKLRYLFLLIYIPFIAVGIFLLTQAVHIPHKLDLPSNSEVAIIDNYDVFDETSDLVQTLEDFRDQTGITVSIFTTQKDEWRGRFGSLERFAYSTYLNNFDDEKHWIFVYSNDLDWGWEGMQGDDTDDILTDDVTNLFNSNLNNYFYIDEYSVADAFTMAFNDIMPSVMNMNISFDFLIFGSVWMVFVLVHMFFFVFYNPNRKYRGYVEKTDYDISNKEQEDNLSGYNSGF